jgi:YggT family protein
MLTAATIIQILQILLTAIWCVILVQILLSWLVAFNVVGRHGQFVGGIMYGLDRLTEPLYRPIRSILPDTRPLDLAPMVVLLLLMILQRAVLPALFQGLATG